MKRQRKDCRYRGTTLVEAAIVFQLLLLVTLAALEYGWLFVNLQRITNAARHGARIAAALNATDAEGKAAILTLVSGMPSPTYDVVTDADTNLVTATVSVPTGRGGGAGVSLIHWDLLPAPNELTAVVTLAKETPAAAGP